MDLRKWMGAMVSMLTWVGMALGQQAGQVPGIGSDYAPFPRPNILTSMSALGEKVNVGPADDVAGTLAWLQRRNCPVPCPTPPERPPLELKPSPTPLPVPQASEPMLSAERTAAFEGETVALAAPNMIGDLLVPSGSSRLVFVTTSPTATATRSFRIPSASHGFKMANNESPRPQNRVFFNFNYFNDVEGRVNRQLGSDIGTEKVYMETFGFEKTFLDGNASLEMRLPLNTLTASGSRTPGLGGNFTDIGNLTVVFKGVLWADNLTGNLISGGLAVTVPTGPNSFAGSGATVGTFQDTVLQPYLGYIWTRGNFFFHGFSALDIPTDPNDVTLLYNDLGVGYFLKREPGGARFVTAVAPTFEVHVNDPLDHRGSIASSGSIPDWVDLTEAVTLEFRGRSTLAVGVSEPVSGLKPYDVEAILQLNVRF